MKTHKFEREEKYNNIQKGLQILAKTNQKKVLNIHIPGTGGRAESEFPTRVAFNNLEAYLGFKADKSHPIPIIFFEGVGSDGEGYIPPAMHDTHTLANKELPSLTKFVKGLTAFAVSEPEDFAAFSRPTALAFGIVKGAGSITNNKIAINTLLALDEDDALPEEIFLSGHSRGAINCISMAYEIYIKFGQRIKINMCLTDPVPGPLHNFSKYNNERVIAPNVISFTAFYASDEERSLFLANDMSRLVFANPNTTVTSHAIPNTDHNSITAHHSKDEKNVSAYLYNEDPANQYLISPVCWAVNHLTFAANGISYENVEDSDSIISLYNQSLIQGTGARSDSVFYRCSPINDQCPAKIQDALKSVRCKLDNAPFLELSHSDFEAQDLKSSHERKEFLAGIYKKAFPSSLAFFSTNTGLQQNPENAIAFQHLKQFKNIILFHSLNKPIGENTHKWVYTDPNGKANTGYFSKKHIDQLRILQKAEDVSCHDCFHVAWKQASDKINMKWPTDYSEVVDRFKIPASTHDKTIT